MAKGRVTQDEFEDALGAAEGMGALKSSGVPRDNPFVKKKSKRKSSNGAATERARPVVQRGAETEALAVGGPVPDAAGDGEASTESEGEGGHSGDLTAAPARRYKDPLLEEVPFSFRYTYREKGDRLARQLQRRKRGLGGDRITAPMVYRVFAELGLDSFVLLETDLVVTEAEFKALVRSRLGLPQEDQEG